MIIKKKKTLLALVAVIVTVMLLNFGGRETRADVFLSFRGRENREGFAYFLYDALVKAGIPTFIDEEGIRRGRNIDSEIERAINESKISIILFSADFASSRYCLDEVVMIMERRKTVGLHVLPLFFKVTTEEVSNQIGSYGQAFAEHEKQFEGEIHKVHQWRAALSEAAEIAGEVYKEGFREAKFIGKVVEIVRNELNNIAHVVKKERNYKFLSDALYYSPQVINIMIALPLILLGLFLACEGQYMSRIYAFVSIGGKDSEKFTSDLEAALNRSMIPIYRDRTKYNGMPSHRSKALTVSKMSIVVFSENYASSKRCLVQLEDIMKRKREDNTYIVIPIFYKVNPYDVQQQTGAYANAFAAHASKFPKNVVDNWREALKEAVQAANEDVVKSIVWFDDQRPSMDDVEDIAERIRKYREGHLN